MCAPYSLSDMCAAVLPAICVISYRVFLQHWNDQEPSRPHFDQYSSCVMKVDAAAGMGECGWMAD